MAMALVQSQPWSSFYYKARGSRPLINDMSYWDGTTLIFENVDYEEWGRRDAENGKTTQVASIPSTNQASYTEGFNFGTYWNSILNRIQL
jgi:hypothetical protein